MIPIPIPPGSTWRDHAHLLPPAEHRIGGSDAAALLGLCPPSWGEGTTPWGMWRRARGEPIAGPDPESLPIRRGRALEGYLLDLAGAHPFGGCVVDPARPWLLGSPDGMRTARRVVECKTAWSWDSWGPGGDIDEWDDTAPVIPPHVFVQACIYLHLIPETDGAEIIVAGPSWPLDPVGASVVRALSWHGAIVETIAEALADAVALRSLEWHEGIRTYRIHRDDDQIAAIVEAVEEARERIMVRGERPPVDGSTDCRRGLTTPATGAARRLVGPTLDLATRFAAAKRARERAEAAEALAANELRAALGSSRALIGDPAGPGRPTPRVAVDSTGRLTITGL